MRDKKGQLSNLTTTISVLIVIGVLIGTGFLVMQKFSEQDNFFAGKTVTNESDYTGPVVFANSTGFTVSGEEATRTRSFVLTDAFNDSGTNVSGNYNLTIPLANLTLNANTGVLTNATATTYKNISVSYTFERGQEGWEGVNDTIGAMQNVPSLLGIIVLIVVIGIVLAVVFNVIPGARTSGA